MINNMIFAEKAQRYEKSNIPYSKVDCQAFVERVLRDCGEKVNFRGSNHMAREMVVNIQPITDFNAVPPGAILFSWRNEARRGYYDGLGNFYHVGIKTGMGAGIMHSSAGGVKPISFNRSSFNRWAYCKYVDYNDKGLTMYRWLQELNDMLAGKPARTEQVLKIYNFMEGLI